MDWEHWVQSARQLPDDHASVARDYQAPPLQGPVDQDANHDLAVIRKNHRTMLERLSAEIRRRDYSIRT